MTQEPESDPDGCSATGIAELGGDDLAQAAGMVPQESCGRETPVLGAGGQRKVGCRMTPSETNGACADLGLGNEGGGKSEVRNPNPEGRKLNNEGRVAEANRRVELLRAYEALLEEGRSKGAACKEVGVGYATMWRWQKRFAAEGFNGLLPDTDRCGRKDVFARLGMTAEEVERVRREVRGLNLDTGSVTASLRLFANSDRCPPDLAAVILDPTRASKHALPPSLRSAARVNEPLRLAHRGPRALQLGGIYTPRQMDILPGDIFTADDTTPIWAWWVPWEESEEYPFGVKLLQGQFIPVMDVASQCVVAFVIIAREKSSYRASDIWHLFGHTFDTVGLPRLGWQLERGSWEANVIRGQEVEYREGEATFSRRVGGLRQLPTNITAWHLERSEGRSPKSEVRNPNEWPKTLQTWTSYLPRSKSIEAWFNRSQALEGTLWGCLGRDQMRAPFEKAKKQFQQCSRPGAKVDPRQHFLSVAELGSRLKGMIEYLNNEPMEGEVFKGVPSQVFAAAVREYPLFRMQEDLKWLYRRDWAAGTKENPLRITNGWCRVRLTDQAAGERYSLFYTNPEVFAQHEGEAIVCYYDRQEFERPAQILLSRTGEFLCEAEYQERKGSFLDGDSSGHEVRKRWRNAVMSVYGTLAGNCPSRVVPAEVEARREGEGLNPKSEIRNPKAEGQNDRIMGEEGRSPRCEVRRVFQPSAEAVAAQRARVMRQAAIARRLRGLTEGNEGNEVGNR